MNDNIKFRRATLWNPTTGKQFSVTTVFEGPGGPRATQTMRADTGKRLCSVNDLSTSGLDRAALRASTLVCLMRIKADTVDEAMSWPEELRRLVYKKINPTQYNIDRGGDYIGFFFIDKHRDNVLEYICIMREAQSFGFGRLLYRHYESWLLEHIQYDQSKRIYLAAINTADETGRQRVIDFYRGQGFEIINDAALVDQVGIDLPPDTTLMSKLIGLRNEPVPAPIMGENQLVE